MSWSAAKKLRTVIENLERILAIEWVAAARGIDLRAPLNPAPATQKAVRSLREHVPGPGPDRLLSPELEIASDLIRKGTLVGRVEAIVGELA